MVVQTQSVHFDADQKLLSFIEEHLQKLEHFFDRIHGASVVLRLEKTGRIQDKITEISLKVPGTVIFVKETSKTFEKACEKAINALKRQLIRYKERHIQH